MKLPNGFDAANAVEAGWTAELVGKMRDDKDFSKSQGEGSNVACGHLHIARATIKSYGDGNLIYSQSRFYRWTGQLWIACDDLEIQQQITRTYESMDIANKVTASTESSVLKLMRSETFSPNIQLDPPDNFINCKNGELHLFRDSWQLQSHIREHYRVSVIPVEYDSNASCPRFMKFLDEIFINDSDKSEKIKILQQYLGYSLTTNCKHEVYSVLIGEGSNGKSVLLRMVENLVGAKNVAAVDPAQFGNKFQRAHLRGKLVNLVTELKQGTEIDDAALKSIVSGELTTAEEKFRDPFDFRPYVKCWFATNHLPHTRDVTFAFFRRAIILEFNRKFQNDKDPHLKDKLIQELPGIFNFALDGLVSLEKDGFTEPASSITAKESWKIEADQVMQFIDEICKLGNSCLIASGELHKKYLEWATTSGITRTLSKITFTKRLKMCGIELIKGTNGIRLLKGIEIHYKSSGY